MKELALCFVILWTVAVAFCIKQVGALEGILLITCFVGLRWMIGEYRREASK